MCCFHLHFSDLNVSFKKNLFQFTIKKITCYAKREKKLLVARKNPRPPPPNIKWSVPYVCTLHENNKFSATPQKTC